MTTFLLGFYLGGLFLLIILNAVARSSDGLYDPLVSFGGLSKEEVWLVYIGVILYPIVILIHLGCWLYMFTKKKLAEWSADR